MLAQQRNVQQNTRIREIRVPMNKEAQETTKSKTDPQEDGYMVFDRPGNILRTSGRMN